MHPGLDQLEAFVAGRLADTEAEQIETHLLECDECGRRLDEIDLSSDHLVGYLRSNLITKLHRGRAPLSAFPAAASAFPDALCGNFGRYRIDQMLGRGGMGVVYQAHDPMLRRNVALKIIAPQRLAQSDYRLRFQREAESAARLQHANIVQVFDFGEQEDVMYCAMELVDGESLAERLEGGVILPNAAAEIVATLAEAVEYAHQRLIIHRDLKPANVLFTADRTPKIADFGLAKRLDDDVVSTSEGVPIGSASYMSPEQASGDKAMGPAVDVYALGALLYEMLVGQPPFKHPDLFVTLRQVKFEMPQPPRRLRPELDRDLESICLKCLEKEPQDRYPSAAALATDLRRYHDGLPILARKTSWYRRAAKLAHRHPIASSLAGMFALAVIAFVVTVVFYNMELSGANLKLTQSLEEEQRTVYALELQRAASISTADPGRALKILQNKHLDPLDDFSRNLLLRIYRRHVKSWDNQGEVRSLAVASGGKVFVSGDQRGTVRIWSLEGDKPPRAIENAHGKAVTDLAFSPDGLWLATASEDHTAKLWNWKTFQPELTLSADENVNGLAFSPDGKLLAAAVARSTQDASPGKVSASPSDVGGTIRLWKLPKGELVTDLSARDGKDSVFRVAFNSDGKRLASVSGDGLLCLWRVENWHHVEREGFGKDVVFQPRKPHQLAVANMLRDVCVATLTAEDDFREKTAVGLFSGVISSLAYSPDGSRLAAGSYDGTTQVWDAKSGSITMLAQPDAQSTHVTALDFQNNDKLLTGTREGRIEYWDLGDRSVRWVAHPERAIDGLAILSDRRLVTSGADGAIRLWDIGTGRRLGEWQRNGASGAGVAAIPDRKCLVWEAGGKICRGQIDGQNRLHQEIVSSELTMAEMLAPTPTGRSVIVADFDGLSLLDANGRKTLAGYQNQVRCLAVSPRQDVMAVADQSADVWIGGLNGETRRPLAKLDSAVHCLAFSATGRQLAAGMENGGATIFDLDGKKSPVRLIGHMAAVNVVTFSSDGTTVATGGTDGSVRLWDPVLGLERVVLKGSSSIRALCFSDDSKTLVAGGDDGFVEVWRTDD